MNHLSAALSSECSHSPSSQITKTPQVWLFVVVTRQLSISGSWNTHKKSWIHKPSSMKSPSAASSRPILFIPPEWQQTQTPPVLKVGSPRVRLSTKPDFRQSSASLVPWLCCCKPSAQLHSQTPALGINHGLAFGWSLFCSTSQLFRLHGPGLRSACQELHHIDSNETLANWSWPSKSISALGNRGAGSVAVEKAGLWFTSVDVRISVAPVLRGAARGDEWGGAPRGNGKIRAGPRVGAMRRGADSLMNNLTVMTVGHLAVPRANIWNHMQCRKCRNARGEYAARPYPDRWAVFSLQGFSSVQPWLTGGESESTVRNWWHKMEQGIKIPFLWWPYGSGLLVTAN